MDEAMKRIREKEINLDKIRGSLAGGAVGDALGYAVEFWGEEQIFGKYGERGITEYELDSFTGFIRRSVPSISRKYRIGEGIIPAGHGLRMCRSFIAAEHREIPVCLHFPLRRTVKTL